MSINDRNIFKFCKIGDIARVKHLVAKEDVQLNVRDKWDSTPLYYACLCGHLEVVEYLLENGARCEANTFDGERCLYGSLTDQIRNVLRNFKVNTVKLDQYDLFLERLFELAPFYDIAFEIKGRRFKAHKCVLATRSEYFNLKFETKWKNRHIINSSNELLVPEAFESVLKYIYTGRFSTLKIHFDSCVRLVKLFKLNKLLNEFEKRLLYIKNDQNDLENPDCETPIDEADVFIMGKFGASSKLTNTISVNSDLEDLDDAYGMSQISLDFRRLAERCLKNTTDSYEKSENPNSILSHDLTLKIGDRCFNVHKAFMAERCDYFKAFLNDPFNEIKTESNNSDENEKISLIELKDIDAEVLIEIIYFIYSNNFSTNKLDENLLYDLLLVAEMYLLPSLKRKCANEFILYNLNRENLFDLLKVSRLYDLKKLEFACVSFLAENLFEFEQSDQLKELIIEDASKLKMRQETDTIDIIDDLRYAINENSIDSQNNFSVKHVTTSSKHVNKDEYFERLIVRENKLNLIDKILKELNLEC